MRVRGGLMLGTAGVVSCDRAGMGCCTERGGFGDWRGVCATLFW